jgi:hypothetical protein
MSLSYSLWHSTKRNHPLSGRAMLRRLIPWWTFRILFLSFVWKKILKIFDPDLDSRSGIRDPASEIRDLVNPGSWIPDGKNRIRDPQHWASLWRIRIHRGPVNPNLHLIYLLLCLQEVFSSSRISLQTSEVIIQHLKRYCSFMNFFLLFAGPSGFPIHLPNLNPSPDPQLFFSLIYWVSQPYTGIEILLCSSRFII